MSSDRRLGRDARTPRTRRSNRVVYGMVAFALAAGGACGTAPKKPTAQRLSPSTTMTTVLDPEVNRYLTAIRSPYMSFFKAANALPTGGACLEAQRQWTPTARQSCQADQTAVIAAAVALGARLAKLVPPTSLQSIHTALIAATQASQDSVAAQLGTLDRSDHQAFLDTTNAIADALSGFCMPIHGLEQYVMDALPVAGGC